MNNIPNQEHLEAAQNDADDKRNKASEKWSPEERAKLEAIEKACQILLDAKVLFYLFPELPAPDRPEKRAVWQWNSIVELGEYDIGGKITKEFNDKNVLYHQGLMAQFNHLLFESKDLDFLTMPSFFYTNVNSYWKYYYEDIAS